MQRLADHKSHNVNKVADELARGYTSKLEISLICYSCRLVQSWDLNPGCTKSMIDEPKSFYVNQADLLMFLLWSKGE